MIGGADPIADRKRFTSAKLSEIRSALDTVAPGNLLVAVVGSYGRHEACEHSDLDFVPISVDEKRVPHVVLRAVHKALTRHVPKKPAKEGAFGTCISRDELLRNIGGNEDTNQNITRRMLLLLEGSWLTGKAEFERLRNDILNRYIPHDIRDHQLAMLLLNDIIRYWRTMAVDYAHKTDEQGKPWAIRNIKLIFSRKLIYASGLFSVAMTVDHQRKHKIRILEDLFANSPLERLGLICGSGMLVRVKRSYEIFLDALSHDEMRRHLETLPREERETDERFRRLKNEGHRFGQELMRLFEQTFPSSHPIRHGAIF